MALWNSLVKKKGNVKQQQNLIIWLSCSSMFKWMGCWAQVTFYNHWPEISDSCFFPSFFSKAISETRQDIAFVTKCLMGLSLIFCPIFMCLICYAKRTQHKQNRMALFTEHYTHKYVRKCSVKHFPAVNESLKNTFCLHCAPTFSSCVNSSDEYSHTWVMLIASSFSYYEMCILHTDS